MRKEFLKILTMAAAVLLLAGCEQVSTDPFADFSYVKEEAVIDTHKVERTDFRVYETLFGTSIPREKLMHYSEEITGYFKEYRIGLLEEVNEGDVVAVLDSSVLDIAIRDQNIRYEKARLKYEKARLTFETTGQNEYDMLSSKLDYEYEEYKYNLLLEQQEALEVRALLSGTITKLPADPGDYVSTSTPLFEVTDDSEIFIRYESKDTKGISIGDILEIDLKNSDDVIAVEVIEINGNEIIMRPERVDESFSRTGTLVYLKLLTDMRTDALVIQESSIIQEAGRTYVYVYDGELLSERDIKTGITHNGYTEVLFGLEEGEDVLTNPGR
ncbi:MAG TPA: HlyD family efflux transporter periplasmic adaptor subunit [Clostridia bacterium]|nr:HlyD family efflux transporter periplasmic adaptor subunit [Clostridia bacterium]HPQ46646.1 HlyD family efflux transporter periplasmic adaptor subunit [Clostridia bacterium]